MYLLPSLHRIMLDVEGVDVSEVGVEPLLYFITFRYSSSKLHSNVVRTLILLHSYNSYDVVDSF
jgi:hypothetical protein